MNIERIQEIISERTDGIPAEDITMESSFEQDLQIMGNDYKKLICDLEDEFNIEFSSYADDFETVFDLVEFMRDSD